MNSTTAALTTAQTDATIAYFRQLQDTLLASLADADGSSAKTTDWQSKLGTGRMGALHGGKLFERGGVNFSHVNGSTLPAAASTRHPHLAGHPYQGGGVSLVLHPHNPYCPTVHMNVRWFSAVDIWWFGGGMDLTPYYGYAEDCRHFHHTCKAALDAHDNTLYPQWKKNCDEYFYLRHRAEARGIGGIFFDDYNQGGFDNAFAVVQAVGNAFLSAYLPIIKKRRHTPYGERQRDWQKYRRGRYVEFNLVYDRGTLFGLQAGGRADAILMSLPPAVCWGEPNITPTAEETALLHDFLPARDWLAED